MHRCQGVSTSTANVYSSLTLTKSNIAVANEWETIKFAFLFLSNFSICLKILIKLGKERTSSRFGQESRPRLRDKGAASLWRLIPVF